MKDPDGKENPWQTICADLSAYRHPVPFTLGGNLAAFAQSTSSNTNNWTVLEYDEQGNVINIITNEGNDQASDSEILEMLENPGNAPTIHRTTYQRYAMLILMNSKRNFWIMKLSLLV